MIYPQNFEQKVGFDRIRLQVGELCTTIGGVEKLSSQTFSLSAAEIEHRLGLCDELRLILLMEGGFPGGEFTDTEQIVKKARVVGAFLEVDELRILRSALVSVSEILDFISSRQKERYPLLNEMSEGIEGFAAIRNHIDSLIDRYGKIKDSASPELNNIRKTIRTREGEVSKKMQRILAQAQSAGIVDADASLSIRDGRTVIPVAAGNKKKLAGFIHDESGSGKTFYIEPVEIVDINNELKELEYEERREIIRILVGFTDNIRPELDGIAASGDYLTEIDLIRAKARWAVSNEAVKPILSYDGRVILRSAKHPLLAQTLKREKKELIPLDISLSATERIIVISGPNAGGKSVCLKTVALLQYMFQCGFPIPALENSEMAIFESLFIDIGDEQSIDNDLSTYSSHLLNMKSMLQSANDRSMVFIDEFGSGTDPVIGGAIAESVLEKLVEKGAYGVITTHYSNIKYFASNHVGVINGAMSFDVQNIRPLFRLERGKPGSSFAIEIARKIGLPEEIIRSAGDKAGGDHVNLERQLREIARDRRYWETKRDKIRLTDKKVEQMEIDYAQRLATLKAERSEIIKSAKEKAKTLIVEANKQIENTIRTIRESQADKELTRLARKEVDDFREIVDIDVEKELEEEGHINAEMERVLRRQQNRAERKILKKEEKAKPPVPKVKEVVVGAKVRIKGQDTVGEVTEVKGNKATVSFGQIFSTVAKERLEVVSSGEYKASMRPTTSRLNVSSDISERKLNFFPMKDVRGLRPTEAIEEVEDFIDNALMVGVNNVTILHGKGTGALKQEIRRYLKGIPSVESALDDHPDRGGAGITVVTFKQ